MASPPAEPLPGVVDGFDFSPLLVAATQVAAFSECTAEEALREFTRFIQLKVEAKDTDAQLISPTGQTQKDECRAPSVELVPAVSHGVLALCPGGLSVCQA